MMLAVSASFFAFPGFFPSIPCLFCQLEIPAYIVGEIYQTDDPFGTFFADRSQPTDFHCVFHEGKHMLDSPSCS